MKKVQLKKKTTTPSRFTPATVPGQGIVWWSHETHELPGRTVTIAEVINKNKSYRGVSIRNPHDCPAPHDGIKFALTRAMQNAKLPKARRKVVWQDFLAKFPKV